MGSDHVRAKSALRSIASIVVVIGPAVALLAGCPGGATTSEPTCSGAQALSAAQYDGTTLGAKQLALTFDDGPGSRTLELSAYLKSKGIRAVFFQNGHCFTAGNPCNVNGTAADPATVEAQLVADGHLVANHTQDHKNLSMEFPAGAAGDMAIVKELTDTDAIIAPYVPFNQFLFRAPYGSFDTRPYTVLHASTMDKYVGSIRWDIGGAMSGNDATGFAADWDCWQPGNDGVTKTTRQCGDRYLNEITAVGRGISLMHDADYGDVANHTLDTGIGNSVDMVKYLVPQLIAAGYTFKRADEVPAIKADLPPIPDAGPDAGPDASDASVLDASLEAAAPDASSSDAGKDGSTGPTTTPNSSSGAVTTPDAAADPCAPTSAPVKGSGYSRSAH